MDPINKNSDKQRPLTELETRRHDAEKLVDSIVGRHAEFFNQPENRLQFIAEQSAEDFLRLSQFVNASLRGHPYGQLRKDVKEDRGGFIAMHTPDSPDKKPAFYRGFEAIKEYLRETTDDTDTQTENVALAIEGLVIWVHPFRDGNGRTSRFLASIIKDGIADIPSLVENSIDGTERGLDYKRAILPKSFYKKEIEFAEMMSNSGSNTDYYDLKLAEYNIAYDNAPDDANSVYLEVESVLSDKSRRQKIRSNAGPPAPGSVDLAA